MFKIDVEEVYMVGCMVVRYVVEGVCGYMVVIKCDSDNFYLSLIEFVEFSKVVNVEKFVLFVWILYDGNYVKEDVLNYI